jgi:hypothetical protein
MGNIVRIKPIGSYPDVRKLANDARGAFDASLNETGQWAKKKFVDITAGWKHQPTFQVVRTQYTVRVDVTGPNAKIFRYVDEGTRAHLIRAKGGGRRRGSRLLTFRTGYKPKTRPNNTQYKGPGVATGGFISKKVVRHPGTAARNFKRIVANMAIVEGRKILRNNLQMKRLPV